MPPIVAKVRNIDSNFVNSVKAQTSGLVTFQYTAGGLKIRPLAKSDHHSIAVFLKDNGFEFFTFNPNKEKITIFVLRGLLPSTGCSEEIAGLREKRVEISRARHIKRNSIVDGVRSVSLLALWVISVLKTHENVEELKIINSILKFVVRIQEYKVTNKLVQCFRCQGFLHLAEYCNIKDKCVKCARDHPPRTCIKDVVQPVKCANCNGQLSSSYMGCPKAKKYQERRVLSIPSQQPQNQIKT